MEEEPGLSPSKRDRERARKQHEKWLARQQAKAKQRRTIALAIAGILALALVVTLVVYLNIDEPGDDAATPDDTPAPAGAQDDDADAQQEPLPSTEPQTYESPPAPEAAEDRTWDVVITTSIGEIALQLDGEAAPQSVANFVTLAQDGYYDGTACHRLLPESLLQCGDPTATGQGGPGYSFGPIENAPDDDMYPASTVAMARIGNDGESMGSQFFLVFAEVQLPSDSAGGYSVFGTVTDGLDILSDVGSGGVGADGVRPAQDVIIESVEVS